MAKPSDDLAPGARPFVVAALCVMVLVAMWRVLIEPARVELAKREARSASMMGELARARAAAAHLPAYERDVRALELALRQAAAGFDGITDEDPDAVLRELHRLAGESELALLSVTPKPVVSRPQYVERPVELVLEGGYYGLGRFLDQLATAPRLMTVTMLDIKTSVRPPSGGSLQITLLISTLVLAGETADAPRTIADRPAHPTPGGTM